MKRTYRFAASIGTATCRLPDGRRIRLPVVPGVLKHPPPGSLARLLATPDAARKYTREALAHAAWPILRRFPADWLKECLADAPLPARRRAALLFLLG